LNHSQADSGIPLDSTRSEFALACRSTIFRFFRLLKAFSAAPHRVSAYTWPGNANAPLAERRDLLGEIFHARAAARSAFLDAQDNHPTVHRRRA
jgi:hypothetical protein